MTRPVLLDTHALLWWMNDAPDLSERVAALIGNADQDILVSAASIWEIAIKTRNGALHGCEGYLTSVARWHMKWGFGTLALDADHVVLAGRLEWSHTDPCDRALVAQSDLTGAPLATCDETIADFHPHCVW